MFFYLTKNNIWFKLSIVLQFLKSTLFWEMRPMLRQKYPCFFRNITDFKSYASEIEAEKRIIHNQILCSRNKIGAAKIGLRKKYYSNSEQKEINEKHLRIILKELTATIDLEEDLRFIREEEVFLKKAWIQFIALSGKV